MPSRDERRPFKRPRPGRVYRTIFVVVTEGRRTEPEYFVHLDSMTATVHVECLPKGDASSPDRALLRMKRYIREFGLRPSDEAWLVVDVDRWSEQQLLNLVAWSAEDARYNVAVSNPRFEFWLLLHFESGNGAADVTVLKARLKARLPSYDKSLDAAKFTADRIDDAIARARSRDNPVCLDWPRTPPGTTVYRLVEKIRTT